MGIFNFFGKEKKQETIVNITPTPKPSENNRMVHAFSTLYSENAFRNYYYELTRTSRGYLDSPDGLYGNFLNMLYSSSPIHGAVINLKTMLTGGNGYTIDGAQDLNMTSRIQLNQLTNQFDQVIQDGLIMDYFIHNRVAILVTWNKDNTKIIKIKRVNPASVNINTINAQMEPIDYLYCWDWALFNTKIPSIKYAKFDQANKVDKTQMLMVQYPSPNQSLYARPTYQPAIKSILLDKESDTYQLAYLKNAVNPSVVISFPFDLDEEEKAMRIDGLRDDFSDTENAGKVFTTFSKGDVLPTITQLNPLDIGKGFLDMTDNTTRKICLGHGVDPQLLGLKTAGSLGNADFIYQFNLFNQGQIQPAQKNLESIFNDFLSINGLSVIFAFNDADINQLNPSVAVNTAKPTEVAAEELEQETIPVTVNDTLRQMSGREYQGMLRVIRQFGQGKITKEQASVMLSSGYGLTDEQITMMLTTQE
jgi:hypothetical protein